jgi:hypothetical protein
MVGVRRSLSLIVPVLGRSVAGYGCTTELRRSGGGATKLQISTTAPRSRLLLWRSELDVLLLDPDLARGGRPRRLGRA